jgi:O-antigen/teichoic acid export membrane protein
MIGRIKNLVFNNIAQSIFQLITILAGFYLTRFIILNFGSELNGLMVSINQILSYFALVEAGISGSIIYALYKPLYDNDKINVNRLLSTSKSYFTKAGFTFLFFTIIYLSLTAYLVNKSSLNKIELLFFLTILSIPIFIRIFYTSKYRSIFIADKKEYFISLSSTIFVITNFLIIIISTNAGYDLIVVKLFAIMSTIIQLIVLYISFNRIYPDYNFKSPKILDTIDNKNDVMWNQVLTGLIHGLPIFIASMLLDFKTVSVLSIYLLLIHSVSGFISVLSNNIVPHLGEILIANKNKLLKKIYEKYEYYYFIILTYSFSCTTLLIQPFLELYTNSIEDANYIQTNIIFLCLILGILNLVKSTRGAIMQADGQFKITKNQLIIQIISAISFGMVLTYMYGLFGLLSSLILSHLIRNFLIFIYSYKKYKFINIKYSFKHITILFIFVFISFIFTLYFPTQFSNYKDFIGYSIVVSIVNLFLILITFEHFNSYYSLKTLIKLSK